MGSPHIQLTSTFDASSEQRGNLIAATDVRSIRHGRLPVRSAIEFMTTDDFGQAWKRKRIVWPARGFTSATTTPNGPDSKGKPRPLVRQRGNLLTGKHRFRFFKFDDSMSGDVVQFQFAVVTSFADHTDP